MHHIEELQTFLLEHHYSQIFVLTDENTGKYCLPLLLEKAEAIADQQAVLLEVSPSGEANKNFSTITHLCTSLLKSNADRDSLIISLGGGVITDIGSFVASIYKRGIQNFNIPTSLLAMTDASIGYKTGINLCDTKNAIGTFNTRTLTFIDTSFLSTLPREEFFNGLAEMLKTFLCLDKESLSVLLSKNDFQNMESSLIHRCIALKESIVAQDLYDNDRRRILNFGHTLAHAFESLSLSQKRFLPHGQAVAIGMFYAIHLSVNIFNLEAEKFSLVLSFLREHYHIPSIDGQTLHLLMPFLLNDKKSQDRRLSFVLLQDIQQPALCQDITFSHLQALVNII